MEDGFGVREQPNLPGTTDLPAYPNWRLKMPLNLEEWRDSRLFARILAALRQERPRVAPAGPCRREAAEGVKLCDPASDLPAAIES